MSTADFGDLFTTLIEQSTRAAERQRGERATPAQDLGLTEPVSGTGTAHDDRITVRMTDGEVTACEIQPIAMRLSNAELGDQIARATNAAIRDYQAALADAMQQQAPDLSGVSSALREIQFQTTSALRQHNDAMFDMLRRVEGRG